MVGFHFQYFGRKVHDSTTFTLLGCGTVPRTLPYWRASKSLGPDKYRNRVCIHHYYLRFYETNLPVLALKRGILFLNRPASDVNVFYFRQKRYNTQRETIYIVNKINEKRHRGLHDFCNNGSTRTH